MGEKIRQERQERKEERETANAARLPACKDGHQDIPKALGQTCKEIQQPQQQHTETFTASSTSSILLPFRASPYSSIKLEPCDGLLPSRQQQHRIVSLPFREPFARYEPVIQPVTGALVSNEGFAAAAVKNHTTIKQEKTSNPFARDSDTPPKSANPFSRAPDTSGRITKKRNHCGGARKRRASSNTATGHIRFKEVLGTSFGASPSIKAGETVRLPARDVARNRMNAELTEMKQEDTLFSYFDESERGGETTSDSEDANTENSFKWTGVKEESQDVGALQNEIKSLRAQLTLERRRNEVLDRLVKSLTGVDQ
ncbi:MAG: hypothetical protein Q9187_001880 [Circinaria calcarea]